MLKSGIERTTNISKSALEIDQTTTGENYLLLITTIVLGVLDVVLILVIVFGYWKYVRRARNCEEKEPQIKSENTKETPSGSHPSHWKSLPEDKKSSTQVKLPAKMRKRSMTFSETDEECRKYREALAESYALHGESDETENRSRKKSVVTFAEIEGNGERI